MKRLFIIVFLGLMILYITGGCSVTKMDGYNMEAIEYTIVTQEDMPREIQKLIEERKEKDFQLTYQDGHYLYLIRGYGRQNTGGYSIQVEELSRGEEYINLTTNLLGPPKDEDKISEPSYPYIVIRTEYRDLPVQFQ